MRKDQLTSSGSTFYYSKEECEKFIQLLRVARGESCVTIQRTVPEHCLQIILQTVTRRV